MFSKTQNFSFIPLNKIRQIWPQYLRRQGRQVLLVYLLILRRCLCLLRVQLLPQMLSYHINFLLLFLINFPQYITHIINFIVYPHQVFYEFQLYLQNFHKHQDLKYNILSSKKGIFNHILPFTLAPSLARDSDSRPPPQPTSNILKSFKGLY